MKRTHVPRLLQEALHDFFNHHMPLATLGVLITITHIRLNPSQDLAKIHLSFMHASKQPDKAKLLAKIATRKKEIKRYLAQQLGRKLRTLPDLQFYIDDNAKQATRIAHMINQLGPHT